MKPASSILSWVVLTACLTCCSIAGGEEPPEAVSFPSFIPWDNPLLPAATIRGGTPPYEVTYRVAEMNVPVGYDFRIDPGGGPLVDALVRENRYDDIGPRRIEEFTKLAGRPPIGTPLHTHIHVTGVDADGAKIFDRFTTLVEVPDDVREELVKGISRQAAAKYAVQEKRRAEAAERAKVRQAQEQAEETHRQAKLLADWLPDPVSLPILSAFYITIGTIIFTICLKLTDAIESLFNRKMEWMPGGTVLMGGLAIGNLNFLFGLGLLLLGRRYGYYKAGAQTPWEVHQWGFGAAAIGMLVAIVLVLFAACKFRNLRLLSRTITFLIPLAAIFAAIAVILKNTLLV